MAERQENFGLAYTIDKDGSLELCTSRRRLEEFGFTERDILLLNTGADLVKTSQGFYRLISVFADRDPDGFYRTYESAELSEEAVDINRTR